MGEAVKNGKVKIENGVPTGGFDVELKAFFYAEGTEGRAQRAQRRGKRKTEHRK
jgi:hypothetical protein